ncbi:TPA: hypothetical protein QFP50_000320 [Enterococcus faecium]|nr:hypothetical protein [Enterococcus faecium]
MIETNKASGFIELIMKNKNMSFVDIMSAPSFMYKSLVKHRKPGEIIETDWAKCKALHITQSISKSSLGLIKIHRELTKPEPSIVL